MGREPARSPKPRVLFVEGEKKKKKVKEEGQGAGAESSNVRRRHALSGCKATVGAPGALNFRSSLHIRAMAASRGLVSGKTPSTDHPAAH